MFLAVLPWLHQAPQAHCLPCGHRWDAAFLQDADGQETPTSHSVPVHGLYGRLKWLPNFSPHSLQLFYGRWGNKEWTSQNRSQLGTGFMDEPVQHDALYTPRVHKGPSTGPWSNQVHHGQEAWGWSQGKGKGSICFRDWQGNFQEAFFHWESRWMSPKEGQAHKVLPALQG